MFLVPWTSVSFSKMLGSESVLSQPVWGMLYAEILINLRAF